jgi:hypothetical protein
MTQQPKFYHVATGWTTALDLTSGQETPIGTLVGHLYYSNHTLLDQVEHDGYPHNGGSHSLTIKGKIADLLARLDMVVEFYSQPKMPERYVDGARHLKILKESLVK